MTITTHNPATGELVDQHDELDAAGIERALVRAEAAWRGWRISPLTERQVLLHAIADRFAARRDAIARCTTLEMGKTFASARAEADKCIAAFRHYADHGPAMLTSEHFDLGERGRAEGVWLPIGAVLAVMPWNFPMWQVVRFLAPAIMAGNVGLLKHASITMGTAAMLADIVAEAGAPVGLFQNLCVRSDAVAGIIADPRVAAVTLTGSEGAGAAVAATAGRHLKKVVLELGGSDPFIVMPSADLDAAAGAAVVARVQNTGQSCICGKRMIVHADVWDGFMQRFEAGMRAVRWGDPFDPVTTMGPLSSFEQRETVCDQVEAIEAAGGRMLFGGRAVGERGAFMDAGIVVDLPRDSVPMREEIFGPVAIAIRVANADEAVDVANAVPYGLGAALFSREEGEVARFVRDVQSGMMAVNQVLSSDPRAPFGGIKQSGYGRELSAHGMREFMNLKTMFYPA